MWTSGKFVDGAELIKGIKEGEITKNNRIQVCRESPSWDDLEWNGSDLYIKDKSNKLRMLSFIELLHYNFYIITEHGDHENLINALNNLIDELYRSDKNEKNRQMSKV